MEPPRETGQRHPAAADHSFYTKLASAQLTKGTNNGIVFDSDGKDVIARARIEQVAARAKRMDLQLRQISGGRFPTRYRGVAAKESSCGVQRF
jgi:hypothetical protein